MSPAASVIMPVYNGEKYLKQAVESVLRQTLPDFEFIILDDGSTDETYSVLEEFARQDARIRLYQNEKNLGLSRTLNLGLEQARSEYIARMDADDICLPERLEKQVAFMDAHPEIGICGTWVETIGDNAGRIWQLPEDHEAIYACILFTNCLAHPSVMIRRDVLRAHNLWYDVRAYYTEDYDLWSRALPMVRFANLPEILLRYRFHPLNTDKKYAEIQQKIRTSIHRRLLRRLGIEPSEMDLSLHAQIGQFMPPTDSDGIFRVRQWLEQLARANRLAGPISPSALDFELGQRWTLACRFYQGTNFELSQLVFSSPLQFYGSKGIFKIFRLLIFLANKIIKK
jgi:glycosyltransferase involved in cell wall biosynthesis